VGAFIVLEGGEGCGKSTQARILYQHLLKENHATLLLHEPGGTPLGEQVRHLLMAHQDKREDAMSPLAELLLFSAARAELLAIVLRPILKEGGVVVCDRYTPSTVAYQGYGRGLSLETIAQVNRLATGGLEPDVVLLLDLPPEDGLRRKDEKERQRFEHEPLAFHRKVRQGYLEQAKTDPKRWLVLDGTLPVERIADTIWHRVEPLLRLRP